MISFLTGIVHHKNLDNLTLLVGGVGYLVALPPNQLSKINIDDKLDLHIHTHIREDAFDLYGFNTNEELSLFKLLISVSGVGPKTALLVMNRGVAEIKQAIITADENFFTLVPRLGKKNAQKIIIELKSKLGGITDLDLSGNTSASTDLLEALLSMGYTRAESIAAIQKLSSDSGSVEDQIRLVLKQMNKK